MSYLKHIGDFFRKYWAISIVVIAAIGFFFFASAFNYLSQEKGFVKWLSPDETANYTVAKLYAETGSLAFFENYNLISKDIIHPRSFRSDWGWIKPVSFIGLPLMYGQIATWFGTDIIPFITPLIGAIGLIFFYLLIKQIFNKENALISTLLASTFPIFTYYSARSMFHNVLFLSGLLAGLYFSSRMTDHKENEQSHFKKHLWGYIFSLCAGLGIGLALIARSSELIWVAPLIAGLWVFNIRRLGILRPFLFCYGVFMVFFPVLYWNSVLYGSFFSSGYPELNNSLFTLTQDSSSLVANAVSGKMEEIKQVLISIKDTIFHFGFNLGQSHHLFNAYVRNMFPWLFWGAAAGILLFLAMYKDYRKRRWLFFGGWALISSILVVYYGSWLFFDNPDPRSFTIGNSYTRYWLPLYFGALPFVSLLLIRVTSLLKYPIAIWITRFVAIAIIATISIQFVWNDPAEGIKVSIEKQKAAQLEWVKVLDLTEPNAVIITRYHDKLLFSERKVIIGTFEDKNMITEYANIAKRIPLYYYNFSYKEEDVAYLNSSPLKKAGLEIQLVEKITDRFNLYKLVPAPLTSDD